MCSYPSDLNAYRNDDVVLVQLASEELNPSLLVDVVAVLINVSAVPYVASSTHAVITGGRVNEFLLIEGQLACTSSTLFWAMNQSTVLWRAEVTVDERSLTSCE